MPRYEVSLIMRLLNREEKIKALTQTCKQLLKSGFNVRKVQSLGDRNLPYQMKNIQGETFMEGSYVLLDMDSKISQLQELDDVFKQQESIIRMNRFVHETVYKTEPYCDGLVESDYTSKLKNMNVASEEDIPQWKKRSLKYKNYVDFPM